MADLDALKQKYAPVIAMIQKFVPYGATLEAVDLADEQLHIKGTVPSTVVADRVWDQIKKVDPTYFDLKHEIGTSGGATQPVTIKSGDTLSAISLLFYGNANKYPQIAKANNLADPNNVPIGTTLQLPVLGS
jgi:nucleoid-associated protein YgaU